MRHGSGNKGESAHWIVCPGFTMDDRGHAAVTRRESSDAPNAWTKAN